MNATLEQIQTTVNGWINDLNPIVTLASTMVSLVVGMLAARTVRWLRTPGEISEVGAAVLRLLELPGWLDAGSLITNTFAGIKYNVWYTKVGTNGKKGDVDIGYVDAKSIDAKLTKRDRRRIVTAALSVRADIQARKMAAVAAEIANMTKMSLVEPVVQSANPAQNWYNHQYLSSLPGNIVQTGTFQTGTFFGGTPICQHCGLASDPKMAYCPTCKKPKLKA